jgi:hypothetical protein
MLNCAALLFAMSIHSGSAWACHCQIPTPQEARAWSDAAFLCEILDVQMDSLGTVGYHRAEVRVEQCWKGTAQPGQVVYVRTPSCIGCCGQEFFAVRMILFVNETDSGEFFTIFCYGNTVPVPYVLEALGPPGCSVSAEPQQWAQIKRLYRSP